MKNRICHEFSQKKGLEEDEGKAGDGRTGGGKREERRGREARRDGIEDENGGKGGRCLL